MEGLIELLHTEAQLAGGSAPAPDPVGNAVFLVHGHDEASLHASARFLEQLRLPFTILREQPNEGRTLIEKFIDYSDVGYAIVLLTPDDRAGPVSVPPEGQMPRARQNVVLELGFFLGKLGRKRVCALYREGVEIPSDYSGVLFVKLDEAGAWRLELAREMKAAGLLVDMNLAL
jgi:predicted nucleotide-binding protein